MSCRKIGSVLMFMLAFFFLTSIHIHIHSLTTHRDDGRLHIWAAGRDKPETVLLGHQSDVKCVDWHPQRALIASGSRDSAIRLWDPKIGKSIWYVCSLSVFVSLLKLFYSEWCSNSTLMCTILQKFPFLIFPFSCPCLPVN